MSALEFESAVEKEKPLKGYSFSCLSFQGTCFWIFGLILACVYVRVAPPEYVEWLPKIERGPLETKIDIMS